MTTSEAHAKRLDQWTTAELEDEIRRRLDLTGPKPCPVLSHSADGWHCAVTGRHTRHMNAAGTFAWYEGAGPYRINLDAGRC